ncbi:SH3 domain-containing protein [Azospirillum soli]|uniref:SH3 domain-containing protein n=1 Tax=Azospirillum soli TaxID=1304799 RepID=UPI001AE1CCEF|nr:SH3 domain-containing protein [Azospirillum soli]MBP2313358.1 uncharacterized protein YgiM (DUF1202 family) [Azospirillum soli]
MRRHKLPWRLLTGLALLLPLMPEALAQPGKEPEHFTPRAAPNAVLPKLAPVGGPAKNAPQARDALRPAPVVPVPLSPVTVPGQPPAPPKPIPVIVEAPPPPSAPPPAPATVIPPTKPEPAAPPPAEVAPADVAAITAPLPPRKPEREAEPPPAAVKPAPEPEKFQAEEPQTGKPKAGQRTVWVKDDVYVRTGPTRSARAVDALSYGEKLDVVGEAPDGWVRVARGGTVLGYVSAKLLTDTAPAKGSYAKASKEDRGCALPDDIPENRRPSIAVGTTARVLADANLRVAPACDAKVRDVLEDGETVTVMGVSGSWYKVGRRGRALGYVGAALLGAAKR